MIKVFEHSGYSRYADSFQGTMPFYKILRSDMTHHGLKYKEGLNVDPIPFRPWGCCLAGGMYFACENILCFMYQGEYICEVTIPDEASVYIEDDYKFKADKFILGKRKKITAKVICELDDQGANFEFPYGVLVTTIQGLVYKDKTFELAKRIKGKLSPVAKLGWVELAPKGIKRGLAEVFEVGTR